MKILLTNDDGIYADGIYALYKELKKIGQVIVVAPDTQKSSVGHAITLFNPLGYKKITIKGRFSGYAVSGMPADCVKLALKVILKKKPDLVVSGINLGPNDGCSVFYSGTIGAAREGSLYGIPSIAVSLDTFTKPNYLAAAKFTTKLAKKVSANGIPKGIFLNVNVPNLPHSKIKGVRITQQELEPFKTIFLKKNDKSNQNLYWMSCEMPRLSKMVKSDTHALAGDFISVTPLQNDLTNYEFMQGLQEWKLR